MIPVNAKFFKLVGVDLMGYVDWLDRAGVRLHFKALSLSVFVG